MTEKQIYSEYGVAAALEAKRLAEKYGQDFLDCESLVEITGLGRKTSASYLTAEISRRSPLASARWLAS